MKQGQAQDVALNNSALFLMGSSKAHCHLMNVQAFAAYLHNENEDIKKALTRLFCLYCISNILDDNWSGVINKN